jgi:hypothetical protein
MFHHQPIRQKKFGYKSATSLLRGERTNSPALMVFKYLINCLIPKRSASAYDAAAALMLPK